MFTYRHICLTSALLLTGVAILNSSAAIAQTPNTPTTGNFSGVTLHVNPQAKNANDKNNGDAATPLKTYAGGFEKMIPLRQSGKNVRILLYPGTYRETLMAHWDEKSVSSRIDRLPKSNAQLVIEAKEKGKAIISGSNVVNNWNSKGNGLWTSSWDMDWGAPKPQDWGGPKITDEVARREVVFVNGKRLQQVLSADKLVPGSFYVDEKANQISVKVQPGQDLNKSTAEIGVRDRLFYGWDLSNITLRGLVFQHSTDKFSESAVSFYGYTSPTACINITLEDNVFRQNGQTGLGLTACSNTTLRRNAANDNGFSGIGGGFNRKMLMEDNETWRNSWRAYAGNYKGWATAGVKFLTADGLVVRRHKALDNQSNGFWLDTDIKNVVIENSLFAGNYENGLFLEAGGGPFLVQNNRVCKNRLNGVSLWSAQNVQLKNNLIAYNDALHTAQKTNRLWSAQILFGELHRTYDVNFPQKKSVESGLKNTNITGNTFVSRANQWLTAAYFPFPAEKKAGDDKHFQEFMNGLKSNGNTWVSLDSKPFNFKSPATATAIEYDFAGWKSLTKQDANSKFLNQPPQALPAECRP